MVCRVFIILICVIIFAHNSYSHGGRLAADGWHNDNKNGGRHCHNNKAKGNEVENDNKADNDEADKVNDEADKVNDDEIDNLRREGNSSPPQIGDKVEIAEIIDCETIRVKGFDSEIKLIGIDCSENDLDKKESENYLRTLLESGEIHITIEKSKDGKDVKDESGKRLAYVFVKEGKCTILVNLAIAWNVKGAKINPDIRFEFNKFFSLEKSDILEHFCDFNLLLKSEDLHVAIYTWGKLKSIK